jgi:hypothetical protein
VLSAGTLSKQREFLKVGMAQHSKGMCFEEALDDFNTFDAVKFVWDKDNN